MARGEGSIPQSDGLGKWVVRSKRGEGSGVG